MYSLAAKKYQTELEEERIILFQPSSSPLDLFRIKNIVLC